ncbi:LysR family transcriptional regulator [Diaphorobacter aerolatus]|uniref:LysR family transcriptional regulator n=1 Tax=Diaphorobacter aerolatus TaxID=1288495 RepID=A0A7H0GL21_9BURK|nr:LysR family transcriptional regulator [Diaphorobacter aerolatus]QNP48987.1 LysR family transcriptional regulator [Diaphorobacter aerolatus]
MDLRDFNLNLLFAFDAVERHRSVSAAAQELELTQPAVTAALNKLRIRFENPLFVRTSHGMHPTPRAMELAPHIKRILEAVRRLDEPDTFSPKTTKNHFKIYVNDVGLVAVLPRVVDRLSHETPNTRLTVLDIRQDEVVSALDNGEIDLAIGHFFDVPNWARQQFLRSTPYVCAMRKDHPVIKDSLSLSQFLGSRHALYWTHGSTYGRLDEALARRGHTRDIALRMPRLGALPFAVAMSDLLVTLPEDLGLVFEKLLPIKLLPVPLSVPDIQVKQYWHERLHADPIHEWFRNLVKNVISEVKLRK